MTIDELRWMTELFRVGKMSRAAENLYITQPALSQCVQRIEQQLGFRLFERSNKGLKPTKKGLLFCEAAQHITNTYQQFLAQAELLDQQELREITIGMAPHLSYCCSVGILSTLQKRYPEIRCQVFEASTANLLESLRENRVQMIVIHEAACAKDLVSHPFGSFPCGVFLRRGSTLGEHAYEENGKRYLDPVWLADEALILARKGQATRIITEQVLKEAGVEPKIVAESGHITTRYRYASEGIASSIGPISGEASALDREQNESVIYRVPPHYKHAYSRFTICALPDVNRLIPGDMFSIIADCIRNNREFGME